MEKLEYKLEGFEGPLDLLLTLIAKSKIDIYDIPIADLLDQYMEQIAIMQEENLDIASEFLEMAARLVQIKSAALLPRQEEEEDPRLELTGILLEYQQCKKVAAQLSEMITYGRIVRECEKIPVDMRYKRIHQPQEILSALLSAWGRGKSMLPPKPENFSALVTRKIVSVTSQVVYVLRCLWRRGKVSYQALFAGKKDRSERVAAFLAVLELVKSKRVRIEGDGEQCEIRLLKGEEQH